MVPIGNKPAPGDHESSLQDVSVPHKMHFLGRVRYFNIITDLWQKDGIRFSLSRHDIRSIFELKERSYTVKSLYSTLCHIL